LKACMSGVRTALVCAAPAGVLLSAWWLYRRRRTTRNAAAWIACCHLHRRRRAQRPFQSNFRVCALVVFRLEGEGFDRHVVGHNDEACNLHNSCCAERAAFLQIAGIAREHAVAVRGVYLTSDAPHALTPGALCREYMLSSPWAAPSTPVHMEGEAGAGGTTTCTLAQLWPLPSPYTRLDRAGQLALGERLGARARVGVASLGAAERRAYAAAVAACAGDSRVDVHPVSYGAAVIFADGTAATAAQKKAMEYGCSIDAVCLLAGALERASSPPAVLCMADQLGVCHAPFAAGRAFLAEHGWGAVTVLVQDEYGALHQPTAEELMPKTPTLDLT
jgi:cytidine deaminase